MKKNLLYIALFLCSAAGFFWGPKVFDYYRPTSFGLVVYGATPAGIISAIAAGEQGVNTLLISPTEHIGGMMTSGLGASDLGKTNRIGGLARVFYRKIGKHYNEPFGWRFESHVAERVFEDWIAASPNVSLLRGQHIVSAAKLSGRVYKIELSEGTEIRGHYYVDASYEGDLMAASGVTYRVGRESREETGEKLAGVQRGTQYAQFRVNVSGVDDDGNLIPGVHSATPPVQGQGDKRLPAYNYRLCLTEREDIRVPFIKPDDYDPNEYELLARVIEATEEPTLREIIKFLKIPGYKIDLNSGWAVSTDYVGANYDYPEADEVTRDRIRKRHETYIRGLLWFLGNSDRVPENVRKEISTWGLCGDEFVDNDNWPYQLYVRAARRMRGQYLLTFSDVRGEEEERRKEDSIGVGTWQVETHSAQRYINEQGFVRNEGFMWVHRGRVDSYQLPYRAITPNKEEVKNLLVPVALSSTHLAYGAVRTETQQMILGQSAAVAAAIAYQDDIAVQDVSISKLQKRLIEQRQVLDWVKGSPLTLK